jgi:hypothetical protein
MSNAHPTLADAEVDLPKLVFDEAASSVLSKAYSLLQGIARRGEGTKPEDGTGPREVSLGSDHSAT